MFPFASILNGCNAGKMLDTVHVSYWQSSTYLVSFSFLSDNDTKL